VVPSAPEVKIGYSSAGRETLQAIEEELAATSLSSAEAPQIEISEAPAGRETLAAIAEELAESMRPRQNTLPYGDRISNAPGAESPRRGSERPDPEIQIVAAPAGRATLAVINEEANPPAAQTDGATTSSAPPEREANATIPASTVAGDLEIFELLTFIVRGHKVMDLSTNALRRRFVEDHLLHRLPNADINAVERVEVTPWTAKGTMVVRIWIGV